MPNTTRIPLCPYYKDEKNKSISCEDTFRRFSSTRKKFSWMDIYCCTWYWTKCPYAMDLTDAYARSKEKGEEALDEQKMAALSKEIKRLATMLGKAEKKAERQEKKIDELRGVNQSFTTQINNLEAQRKRYFEAWRKADEELKNYKVNVGAQLEKIIEIYEARLAYLIDTYCPDKILRESEVKEWADGKSFAVVSHKISDEEAGVEGEQAWKVAFEKEKKETEDACEDLQTYVQEGPEVRQPESAD